MVSVHPDIVPVPVYVRSARRVPQIQRMEATMELDDVFGTDLEDALHGNEARWLERTPPELDWDESEVALIVEGIVGGFGTRAYH